MSILKAVFEPRTDDYELDIVLLHGMDGDPFATWSHTEHDSSVLHWLSADYPMARVWTVQYEASSSLWVGHPERLNLRAEQLLSEMLSQGLGARPMVWVGHSLGGRLITAACYVAALGHSAYLKILEALEGVVFLSVPHHGNDHVSLLRRLGPWRPSPLLADVDPNDPLASEVTRQFPRIAAEHAVRVISFVESENTRLLRGLIGVRVVSIASATIGVGRGPIILDADHISISKPQSRSSPWYFELQALIASATTFTPPVPAVAQFSRLWDPLQGHDARHFLAFDLAQQRFVTYDGEPHRVVREVSSRLSALRGMEGRVNPATIAEASQLFQIERGFALVESSHPTEFGAVLDLCDRLDREGPKTADIAAKIQLLRSVVVRVLEQRKVTGPSGPSERKLLRRAWRHQTDYPAAAAASAVSSSDWDRIWALTELVKHAALNGDSATIESACIEIQDSLSLHELDSSLLGLIVPAIAGEAMGRGLDSVQMSGALEALDEAERHVVGRTNRFQIDLTRTLIHIKAGWLTREAAEESLRDLHARATSRFQRSKIRDAATRYAFDLD